MDREAILHGPTNWTRVKSGSKSNSGRVTDQMILDSLCIPEYLRERDCERNYFKIIDHFRSSITNFEFADINSYRVMYKCELTLDKKQGDKYFIILVPSVSKSPKSWITSIKMRCIIGRKIAKIERRECDASSRIFGAIAAIQRSDMCTFVIPHCVFSLSQFMGDMKLCRTSEFFQYVAANVGLILKALKELQIVHCDFTVI